MLYDLGRWDELLEVAEGIRRVEEAHGAAQPGAMAGTYAAFVLIRRGALDKGAPAAEDMLELARRIEDSGASRSSSSPRRSSPKHRATHQPSAASRSTDT